MRFTSGLAQDVAQVKGGEPTQAQLTWAYTKFVSIGPDIFIRDATEDEVFPVR